MLVLGFGDRAKYMMCQPHPECARKRVQLYRIAVIIIFIWLMGYDCAIATENGVDVPDSSR